MPKRGRRGGWILLFLMLLAGCAALQTGSGPDPAVLIIRNRSGQEIGTVTLSAAVPATTAGQRYGSISPLPRGASQIFVRPASAPRLPTRLKVSWDTIGGLIATREISLRPPLSRRPPEAPSDILDALVFEIQADQAIIVYREAYSP